MKKVNVLMVLISCTLLVSGAFAATYYVSEFGDDTTGDGSATYPWATIQKAADAVVAGDTIIVQFGEYAETVVPKANGTDGSPIVIQAEEKGEATISTGPAFSDALVYTQHADSIWVAADVFRDVTSVTEDGAALIGRDHVDSLYAGTWYQDRAESKLYVIAKDKADPATHIDTVNFAQLSFDIAEGSYLTIDGFVINNGIQAVTAANEASLPGLIIQNNEFVATVGGIIAIQIDGGAADTLHTYEDFVISDNLFTNDPEYFSQGILIRSAGQNSTISDNIFKGSVVPTDAGGAAIRVEGSDDYAGSQCRGLVVERNFFNEYDTRCLYLRYGDIHDVTFQNNILYRNKYDKPSFQTNTRSLSIDYLNNTHFGITSHGVYFQEEKGATGRVMNNIFSWGGGKQGRGGSWYLFFNNKQDSAGVQIEVDYNYWVTDTSMTSARDDQLIRGRNPSSTDLRGSGTHAVWGHPLMARLDTIVVAEGDTVFTDSFAVTITFDTLTVDSIPDMWFSDPLPLFTADTASLWVSATAEDFMPVEGSKAIDAGNPDVAPAVDFLGAARDEHPDIGALEYGGIIAVDEFLDRLFPEDYALSQNYPNPFNLSTMIEYKLPKAGFVKLTVYNLLGQRVATLVDGVRSNGTHTVTWNGRDSRGSVVPSGIYFCRLEAGSVSRTVKMLLLK